jgi:CxxC motif-containing protein (DUF1111 family)
LTAAAAASLSLTLDVSAQNRADRFRMHGSPAPEDPSVVDTQTPPGRRFSDAPTGFDSLTNGYLDQGPDYDSLTEGTLVPFRSFNDDRFIFEEVESRKDGLGPVYNAQACRECHQNVATGGASQVAEHRTGRLEDGVFFESLGGSLIHSRATDPRIVERVSPNDKVRTFRISTNTLGSGFVEAIPNNAIIAVSNAQPAATRGTVVQAPVLEASVQARIGRFGWKAQHASLVSFSADAYLNEMGITSPLLPEENTSSGVYVGFGTEFDPVKDPEDDGTDVQAFADFMRSTKAPARGDITADALAGETVFNQVGCAICHTPTYRTSPAGTPINGGTFKVPAALGDKTIHPYSDFLLHDVGTGDGIPISPDLASTANQMRTAPLWALRTRSRLMHDGLTFTLRDAVERHAGQAAGVVSNYEATSDNDKATLEAFLNSL